MDSEASKVPAPDAPSSPAPEQVKAGFFVLVIGYGCSFFWLSMGSNLARLLSGQPIELREAVGPLPIAPGVQFMISCAESYGYWICFVLWGALAVLYMKWIRHTIRRMLWMNGLIALALILLIYCGTMTTKTQADLIMQWRSRYINLVSRPAPPA